jgi:hypothetical protein
VVSQRVDFAAEPTNVTVDADGALTVQAGSQAPLRLRVPGLRPGQRVRTARAEAKSAAGGEQPPFLFITTQTTDGNQQLTVIARADKQLVTAYAGPIGPVGRDGEYALAVEPTAHGLLRYQRVPGLGRCDGEDRLFVERYQAPVWRPAPELGVPAWTGAEAAQAVTASPHAPAGISSAPLGVYRFVSASAQLGAQRADLLAPPQELEDSKPATAWRVPADARGAFVTARADGSGHSVQFVRITPAPAAQGALPRQLALVFDARQHLLVNLPPSRDGAPQWIALPTPVATSCLSLVVTQPADKAPVTALGKVAIFSELDADTSAAGLRRLAERAASADSTAGEAAARTLRALIEREKDPAKKTPDRSTALLQALGTVLPTAKGAGRRRLQDALLELASVRIRGGLPGAELAQALVRAVTQAELDERPPLWSAIGQLGSDAEDALVQLAGDAQKDLPSRSEALRILGGLATPGAVRTLLALTQQEVPADRPLQRAVVAGLGAALRCRSGQAGSQALSSARAAVTAELPPKLAGRTLLVEGLALAHADCSLETRTALADALVALWQRLGSASAPGTDETAAFTLRYRILQSLGRLSVPGTAGAELLRTVLTSDRDPVLRQTAALSALSPTLAAESVGRTATQVLGDSDPGVRLTALAALAERPVAEAVPAIERTLRQDHWPLCRRAAAESRAAQCARTAAADRNPALRQAVRDSDEGVQRLALAGLARCEGAGALDVYTERLRDGATAPAVRTQACALLVRYGFAATGAQPQQQAHDAVSAALAELLTDPAADERSANTIITCTRAVGELGDGRDLQTLLHMSAVSAEIPPPIRQTALESVAKVCARRPALPPPLRKDLGQTLQAATRDPEPRIQAAAQRALSRCTY